MGTTAKGPGRPRRRADVVALVDRRPPPRVPVDGLTEAQQIALAKHLCARLDHSEVARLFYAVEEWFGYGPASATLEARKRWASARQRYASVAELAGGLREALADPQWEETDRELLTEVTRRVGIGHSSLMTALERLTRMASGLSQERNANRPRGPPPVQWRDSLIALVNAHYPAAKRSKAQFSHFEDTIALLLGFLGSELADLHKQVVRTLKRSPTPPLALQLPEHPAAEPRAYLPWSAAHRART